MREVIITNVLSMVIGAIVLGAGAIVWNENSSNKTRIGHMVGEMVKLQKEINQLRGDLYDLEENVINGGCYSTDGCAK